MFLFDFFKLEIKQRRGKIIIENFLLYTMNFLFFEKLYIFIYLILTTYG